MNRIILYGSETCHKTKHYISYFNDSNLAFSFFDVVKNEKHAQKLKSLYETNKLNFPTILVDDKKLRNPSTLSLNKWLIKKGITKN